jgi:CSLREA domain-containing protein
MSMKTVLRLALSLVLVAGARVSHGATITTDDTSGSAGGSTCTLRDAITAANTDTAVAGCAEGDGADTIQLLANAVYTLTERDNTEFGFNGLPSVGASPRAASGLQ